MNLTRAFTIGMAALLLAACAHPIKVAPDLTRIEPVGLSAPKVPFNVGYYIPLEVSSVEITTPGGGGDNIRYFPYRDIETGYQRMLANVFTSAVKLSSMTDQTGMTAARIDYIIIPDIVTSSGGSGLFTWPPTSFTVDLTCNIRDTAGKTVTTARVVGTGSAETGERLREHGIAGSRAMEDALRKMQSALLEAKLGDAKADAPRSKRSLPTAVGAAGDRLAHLKELKDQGLISEEEYKAKRKEILDSL